MCAIAKNRRALLILFIGSVPAGLIGFLLADFFEQTFRSVEWVVVFLALGTVLMFLAEKFYLKMWHNQRIDGLGGVTNDKALKIGLFQSLALFPGFSRSGSSISGGMLLGLNRELAAKFSFLLSVPIVLLAAIFKLINSYGLLFSDSSMHGAIVVGFFASFFAGVIWIKVLLGYLKTKSLNVFLIYRLLLVIFLSLLVLR